MSALQQATVVFTVDDACFPEPAGVEALMIDQTPLLLWQSALMAHGCKVNSNGRLFPLELQPCGNRIVCKPSMNGWMVPFHVMLTIDKPMTITWDSKLSRYVVTTDEGEAGCVTFRDVRVATLTRRVFPSNKSR